MALEGPGYVRSFTVPHRDLDEGPLETPLIVAMVSWPEARGGLIHRLGEVEPDEVELGMAVEPAWFRDRTGAMSDTGHFRPITE